MNTDLQMNGTVRSGGTAQTLPLAGVSVTLYEATTDGPLPVGTATTDADGKFSLNASSATSNTIFYATASLGGGVQLATIIGPNIPASITINELTTVAAAFSMAQFTQNGVIAGNAFGLRIASGMNDNLVSPLTGASSDVLVNSPNGDETNSLRSTRSLANLLAACVQKPDAAVEALFELTTPPDGTAPNDTLQALVNICLNPAHNVAKIYNAQAVEMYSPTLQQIKAPFQQTPDAWTIAVKVNNSGDASRLFGGPGNLVFDKNGYAWITNNVPQGKPTSADYNIVLKPNGKPADRENGTLKSPISGGGILGGGFGIEIDTRGTVWMGNFGWGGDNPTSPEGNGSVSQFNADGTPISEPDGYQGGVLQAQGIVSDQDNNIWIASNGSDQVFVFPNGDPASSFSYPVEVPDPAPDGEKGPFDIALAPDGTGAWVTYAGGLAAGSSGGVSKYFIADGARIEKRFKVQHEFKSLKGMSLDSQGNAWIASGGEGVYLVSSDGTKVSKPFTGGGVSGPWSVTVDGDDNVWVANFGSMLPGSVYGNDGTNAVKVVKAAISKLAGANTPDPGKAISPDTTGYTLPSAGDPVLLNNQPLYGARGPAECFSPLMRQTNLLIDQAGNVWALNNWKPDFNVDTLPDNGTPPNPGGDGIVIFVGLAKPPIKKH
jgi:hypothetical protein